MLFFNAIDCLPLHCNIVLLGFACFFTAKISLKGVQQTAHFFEHRKIKFFQVLLNKIPHFQLRDIKCKSSLLLKTSHSLTHQFLAPTQIIEHSIDDNKTISIFREFFYTLPTGKTSGAFIEFRCRMFSPHEICQTSILFLRPHTFFTKVCACCLSRLKICRSITDDDIERFASHH